MSLANRVEPATTLTINHPLVLYSDEGAVHLYLAALRIPSDSECCASISEFPSPFTLGKQSHLAARYALSDLQQPRLSFWKILQTHFSDRPPRYTHPILLNNGFIKQMNHLAHGVPEPVDPGKTPEPAPAIEPDTPRPVEPIKQPPFPAPQPERKDGPVPYAPEPPIKQPGKDPEPLQVY